MASIEAEILGVGGTGFADPQSVQTQQGGQSSMV